MDSFLKDLMFDESYTQEIYKEPPLLLTSGKKFFINKLYVVNKGIEIRWTFGCEVNVLKMRFSCSLIIIFS